MSFFFFSIKALKAWTSWCHLSGQKENFRLSEAKVSLIPQDFVCDPGGLSSDEPDYLLVGPTPDYVASFSYSRLVKVIPVSPFLLDFSCGLRKGKSSFPFSHYLQGFCTAGSPS